MAFKKTTTTKKPCLGAKAEKTDPFYIDTRNVNYATSIEIHMGVTQKITNRIIIQPRNPTFEYMSSWGDFLHIALRCVSVFSMVISILAES